ncbi:metal ABC transporter permease, partial [Enterococcus italicus]
AIFGVVASICGLYFSYTFNWASGPAIVIVAAGLFLISFIFSPKQNLLHLHKNRKEA